MLTGFDPETQRADPSALDRFVVEMRSNPACGGLCQSAAAMFDDLGERERGIVYSDVQRALQWATDPAVSEAIQESDFSLREIVESSVPRTFYQIFPVGSMEIQKRLIRVINQLAMRHAELRENRTQEVHFILDEFFSYGQSLEVAQTALVALRAAKVRLHVYLQYFRQLEETLGKAAADAFEATSDITVFGVGDLETAEFASRRIGKRIHREYRGFWPFRREIHRQEAPLMAPVDILSLLEKSSPIQLYLPAKGPPMLTESLCHKRMKIDGIQFHAWPLDGATDEHLIGPNGPIDAATARPREPGRPRIRIVRPDRPSRVRIRRTGEGSANHGEV